jgi:hypothetical protein
LPNEENCAAFLSLTKKKATQATRGRPFCVTNSYKPVKSFKHQKAAFFFMKTYFFNNKIYLLRTIRDIK